MRRLALGAIVCSALLMGGCSAGPTGPGETQSPRKASTSESLESPSADPGGGERGSHNDPEGTFPDVVGRRLANARPVLKARGLAVTVKFRYSSESAGTVLQQKILPGTDIHPRTIVILLIAKTRSS
jgi:hypothetical protein